MGRCLARASSTDDIGPSTNAAGSHWLTAGVRRIYTPNAGLTGRSLRSRYDERMKTTAAPAGLVLLHQTRQELTGYMG
jgi:hypothetical protein